jgi:hypothetical protein
VGNHTLQEINGTWVATEVLWDGQDQSAFTENTLILTGALDYVIIEVPQQFGRYQDGGTYTLINQGNTLAFNSEGAQGASTANIVSVDAQFMVLEYSRTYLDINNNPSTVQIKATYKKQ